MTQKVAPLLSTSFKVASNRTVDHEQLCEVGYFFIPFINKYAGEDDEYFIEQENKRKCTSRSFFGFEDQPEPGILSSSKIVFDFTNVGDKTKDKV